VLIGLEGQRYKCLGEMDYLPRRRRGHREVEQFSRYHPILPSRRRPRRDDLTLWRSRSRISAVERGTLGVSNRSSAVATVVAQSSRLVTGCIVSPTDRGGQVAQPTLQLAEHGGAPTTGVRDPGGHGIRSGGRVPR
jgi:hypothetical protein